MKNHLVRVTLFLCAAICWAQPDTATLPLKTASHHPVQYYLSLPHGWTIAKKYPVVVIIESANREFQKNAEEFVKARGDMPFILVAPLVLTAGGTGYRQIPTYHYSDAVWAEAERVGRCQFDFDGIAAIVSDVQKLYGGEDKYFMTGWEAGGHTVLATVFRHPEALRAAAPSGPNYIGRCMEDGAFSSDPARVNLPVRAFLTASDPATSPNGILYKQWQDAKQLAQAHGYRNVSDATSPAKVRNALAEDVLAYFFSLLKQ